MLTVRGICLNLNESEYYYKYQGLIFYFSSEIYKNKFANTIKQYLENETLKIQIKYNVNINFDILLMISYYKKIEKRGFRIYDEENKKEITPSCGIVAKIIMY